MTGWSLSQLLATLHSDVEHRLRSSRASFGHPVLKGDASEAVWLDMLQTYLPRRKRRGDGTLRRGLAA